MSSIGKTILMIGICLMLGGCSFHFKASEVEVDTESKDVQSNRTYELEKVMLFEALAKK